MSFRENQWRDPSLQDRGGSSRKDMAKRSVPLASLVAVATSGGLHPFCPSLRRDDRATPAALDHHSMLLLSRIPQRRARGDLSFPTPHPGGNGRKRDWGRSREFCAVGRSPGHTVA